MFQEHLPKGTRVRVLQDINQADPSWQAVTVGVIEAQEEESTGAWYAHGRNGKLGLERLTLRKPDGEVSVLTIDDQTLIQSIETEEQ